MKSCDESIIASGPRKRMKKFIYHSQTRDIYPIPYMYVRLFITDPVLIITIFVFLITDLGLIQCVRNRYDAS